MSWVLWALRGVQILSFEAMVVMRRIEAWENTVKCPNSSVSHSRCRERTWEPSFLWSGFKSVRKRFPSAGLDLLVTGSRVLLRTGALYSTGWEMI